VPHLRGRPGVDVLIFKILSLKNLVKKLALLPVCAKFNHNIVFLRKRQFVNFG
jgi:hypothetical protein